MNMRRILLSFAAIQFLALMPVPLAFEPADAGAHDVRPGYLEFRETEPGAFRVFWKKPVKEGAALRIDPVLPAGCAIAGIGSTESREGVFVARGTMRCEDGLAGQSIEIAGLEATQADVLVRIYYESGQQETHLVRPGNTTFTIGGASGIGVRLLAYVRLGMEHIALGIDHLLFVLGLLLIVSNTKTLVKTITAFTVAHSITLGLATLGLARAPELPLNAVIALSILFLGPEIVRVWRGQTSFTIQHPWVVAFAFGLLHGFGFASGLTAMGLPANEIPLALLFFNIGVELGQLAFVFLVLGLARSFKALEINWPRWAEMVPGYAVGTLGAFWFIERTTILMGWM